ncbi:MAG: hypothetical protein ABL996_15105 [Micropepsaceae bacterium]
MSNDEIGAAEAYAFLRVLAPKLAQLKQRLRSANDRLKIDDADDGRVNALIEAQLALKDFLNGLQDFNALVEPIDIVVQALREEAVEQQAPLPAPPAPAPPVVPPIAEPVAAPSVEPVVASKRTKPEISPDAWLRIGTITAVQKLINAGMSAANAESYLANTYASIGLTQRDGAPITVEQIRAWLGPRAGSWRNNSAVKRKMGGLAAPRGPAALTEAQSRVDELSAIFKRMAASAPN